MIRIPRVTELVSHRIGLLLALLVLATLLLGYLDRPILFHDELINTYKARTGLIFDYAVRPLFYFIGYISIRVLGTDPRAFSMAVVLLIVIGGLLTYSYLRRTAGVAAGLAGVAAYAWLGWIYSIGIGAMPNLPPAVFMLGALYVFHGNPIEKIDWPRKIGISILIFCALASHPTSAALIAAFYLVVTIGLLRTYLQGWISIRSALIHLVTWAGLAILMPLILEAMYRLAGDGATYWAAWSSGLEKTHSNNFSQYFQPFSYYFGLMVAQYHLLLIILGAAITFRLTLYWRGDRGSAKEMSSSAWQAIDLLIYTLAALLVISTQQWKFVRVAATFAPFVSLSILAVTFQLIGRSNTKSRFISTTLAVIVMACSLAAFSDNYTRSQETFSKKQGVYSEFLDHLRAVPGDSVGYIGRRKAVRMAEMQAVAAGKSLEILEFSNQRASARESIVDVISNSKYLYVIVDDGDYPSESGQKLLRNPAVNRVAVYRNRGIVYELWSVSQMEVPPKHGYMSEVVERLLSSLGARIRYDRVSGSGVVPERQIYIEVVGPDIDEAERALTSAFRYSGFVARRGMVDAGGVRLRYSIDNALPVDALVRDGAASPSFKDPHGTSSIYLKQKVR